MEANKARKCECADRGCSAHEGTSHCEGQAILLAYRSDMNDITGTLFCEACADDAEGSGLYDWRAIPVSKLSR